jgi:hypothetical protein
MWSATTLPDLSGSVIDLTTVVPQEDRRPENSYVGEPNQRHHCYCTEFTMGKVEWNGTTNAVRRCGCSVIPPRWPISASHLASRILPAAGTRHTATHSLTGRPGRSTYAPRCVSVRRHRRVTDMPRDGAEHRVGRPGRPNQQVLLKRLRTVCGLRESRTALTCANAPIHTLKRNSTTSPSCMT